MAIELYTQLVEKKIDKMSVASNMSMLKIKVNVLSNTTENFGPATTTYCLRSVAGILKTKMRNIDSCTRAGNELTLILPQTDSEEAKKASRRVTEIVRDYMERAGFKKVSFNIGIATLSDDDSAEDVILRAERELRRDGKYNRGLFLSDIPKK